MFVVELDTKSSAPNKAPELSSRRNFIINELQSKNDALTHTLQINYFSLLALHPALINGRRAKGKRITGLCLLQGERLYLSSGLK
ncbi:hypothetical protein CEXT_92961 [Caerostris extrusa]|uniref:Uncharacterized protein n=1 Tax=Caerostris extrusa TaxID=172846 RepID=A0AAV4MQG3_CAEEX|nr:hypothetical protein CEXT_92961 [Caerostris extrusa]